MKRFFALATVSVALISLSSCKKDYTCECTTTIGGTVYGTPVTTTINDKKDEAKTACENGSSSTTFAGVTTSVTCVIKD